MKQTVCTLFGLLGAGIAWAFGGWDAAMAALLVCMGVDYVSGFPCAASANVLMLSLACCDMNSLVASFVIIV